MSDAVSGVGTKFRRWNTSTKLWETISEINSVSGPRATRATIDVTSLDSEGGYREFIAGFRDAGTISLNMNFTRSGYELMKDDFESDVIKDYEVVLPDVEHTTLEFQGLVTEVPLDIPMDNKITCAVTIKISGPVNVGSGSGPSAGK